MLKRRGYIIHPSPLLGLVTLKSKPNPPSTPPNTQPLSPSPCQIAYRCQREPCGIAVRLQTRIEIKLAVSQHDVSIRERSNMISSTEREREKEKERKRERERGGERERETHTQACLTWQASSRLSELDVSPLHKHWVTLLCPEGEKEKIITKQFLQADDWS